MNNSTKNMLALAGACAVGIVIGMLLAPEKGSDLRKRVSDSLGGLGDKVNDILANGKEKADELVDDFSDIKSELRSLDHSRKLMS